MDFQKVVDSMHAMTCVVSVEKLEGGNHGKLRIVAGNRAYIDSIEKPQEGIYMLKDRFVPNSEYTDYLPRDLNFEDFCYRAAVEKKCLHSYVHPDRFDVWFNMTFLPLSEEDGNICYCTYTMEINAKADTARLSNVDSDTAASVLETTIKLRGTTDFNNTMKDIIKDIRDLCEAEHCCILLMDDIERKCEVLCEAFAPGSKLHSMERYADDGFYEIAETWEETIAGSNCIIAKNEADMDVIKERNPVWYRSVTSAGAENIVLFPLKSRDTLLGYIWVVNFNPENAQKIKETLELTTFILASEIANYLLLDRLKILSSRDMLTGVNNRNEMNNLVDELCKGEDDASSVGVAFADLNGLKNVNDAEGHPAGDRLLKDAASALREVFDDECIFRAGGDEFSIIIRNITEDELNEKVERLREVSRKYDKVIFAVGCSVVSDEKEIRSALRKADERMYADKERFYAKHPEKRRGVIKDKVRMNFEG